MNRKISHSPTQLTTEQVEEQLARYTELSFVLQEAKRDQQADSDAMNADLLPIKERYRPRMEQRAGTIHDIQHRMSGIEAEVMRWAVEHRQTRFLCSRSLELLHATLSFRLGNFQVVEQPRRTFERAVYWLGRVTWGARYLRLELNRERLLEDRVKFAEHPERLRKIGLAIVQEERFSIRIKKAQSALHHPEAMPLPATEERRVA